MNLQGVYDRAADVGEDNAEYFVPVKSLYQVPESKAFSEIGLFGNQNTIARPRNSKWIHTVDRLKQFWGMADD